MMGQRHNEAEDSGVPLEHHLEGQILALTKVIEAKFETITTRFDSMDKAIQLAVDTTKDKFSTTNEWRGVVTDGLGSKVDQGSYDTKMTLVDEDIRILRESKAVLEGKASQETVNEVSKRADRSYLLAIGALIFTGIGTAFNIGMLLISRF